MTRDDIIRMAREVGIDAESDTLCRHEGWVDPLTSFAERVFLNIDPSKLMSFQEGYAAGVAAEREACAKMCEDWPTDEEYVYSIGVAIRARGEE